MPARSQTFLIVLSLAALERALSLHGATSIQIPSSTGGLAEASMRAPMPLSAPPPPTASPSGWSLPWNRPQQPLALVERGPLLVQPLAAASREDHIGIALPELKIQRFGRKFDDSDQVPAEHTAAHTATAAGAESIDSFFQIQEVDSVPSSPKAMPPRQVGEVSADVPTAGQGNTSSPDVPDPGIGFVAAAKPPPSLSEVPPLPFAPDDVPAAIHVAAIIATQEVSASSKQGGKSAGSHAGNASVEDQEEAWSNFTAAEALAESSRGHNRDTEALGTDAASEALPVATHGPGTSPPKDLSAAGLGGMPKASRPSAALDAGGSTFVFWLFGISCTVIVGGFCVACLGVGCAASFAWQRRFGTSTIRSNVEDLPLWSASEVERRLPVSGGYDCHFSKPLSSGQLLRLEAYVDGPSVGREALTNPLNGQACVLYSVAVSRQLHDGIRPAPVAFASGSIDFVITLKDAPHVRINVLAEEVSLFDMRRGRRVERKAFAAAPDKWQDFILTHRAGTEWQTSSQLRADSSSLEFQECALVCGTLATFVGELHRGSDGTLSLRPVQLDSLAYDMSGPPPNSARSRSATQSEPWRTSWECDTEVNNIASPRIKNDEGPLFEKVMVSDDPLLLDGASSLLHRLPAKCSSRAMAFVSKYRYAKFMGSEKSPSGMEAHTL